MSSQAHWDTLYRTKASDEMSWFQAEPRTSVAFIRRAAPDPAARIIDVGGGASSLVDRLIDAGYRALTVLDLSGAALETSRRRGAPPPATVDWIEGDVLTVELPLCGFDVWHDRAVFHFLTAPADRARYAARLRRAIEPGGQAVIATFAEDGPTRCSGLPVVRYSADALQGELGPEFTLVETAHEGHVTPAGVTQAFMYARLRFEGPSGKD
jgi:SAM-dependent methyltransferase